MRDTQNKTAKKNIKLSQNPVFKLLNSALKKTEQANISFGCIENSSIIKFRSDKYNLPTFQENLEHIAKTHKNFTPDLLTLLVRLKKSTISNAEIKPLLMEAICDAFKIHYPNKTELQKMRSDQRKLKQKVSKTPSSTNMNMKGFMTALNKTVDNARISKALTMLKNSKFQLYLEVSNNDVIGIIKSQSDHSLVYSCHISRQGEFSCCTQNLNTCGGLRGRICKHILVLVIGLAQNKEMHFSQLYQWINNSCSHKPKLDRDKMSEVLLKYKGAEAGEIDWRPSETVPEDYYLF